MTSKAAFYYIAAAGLVECAAMSARPVFAVALFAASMSALQARAAIECVNLVNAAQAAVDLRDKGVSLSAVMAETERAEMKEKFNAQELNMLRQVMRFSYTGEYSIRDIHEACEAGELGIPRKKK